MTQVNVFIIGKRHHCRLAQSWFRDLRPFRRLLGYPTETSGPNSHPCEFLDRSSNPHKLCSIIHFGRWIRVRAVSRIRRQCLTTWAAKCCAMPCPALMRAFSPTAKRDRERATLWWDVPGKRAWFPELRMLCSNTWRRKPRSRSPSKWKSRILKFEPWRAFDIGEKCYHRGFKVYQS